MERWDARRWPWWCLAAGLLALYGFLAWSADGAWYGTYHVFWPMLPLLAAVWLMLPLGGRKRRRRLPAGAVLTAAAALTALALYLFSLFRPAYTLEDGYLVLMGRGYRAVRLTGPRTHMTIRGGENPFVRSGIVFQAEWEGRTVQVLFDPVTGECRPQA